MVQGCISAIQYCTNNWGRESFIPTDKRKKKNSAILERGEGLLCTGRYTSTNYDKIGSVKKKGNSKVIIDKSKMR